VADLWEPSDDGAASQVCTSCFLQPAEADAILFMVCLSVQPLKIIDFMSTGPLDLFRVHFE